MDVVKLLFRCDRVNFAVTITLGTKAPKHSIVVNIMFIGTMDWCRFDSYTTEMTPEDISAGKLGKVCGTLGMTAERDETEELWTAAMLSFI